MENFNCPICKKQIITAEGECPCEHTAFLYLSLVANFITVTDEVMAVTDDMENEIGDQEDFVNELAEKMKDEVDVYMWEDSGADSCGLHCTVVHIGIWKDNS